MLRDAIMDFDFWGLKKIQVYCDDYASTTSTQCSQSRPTRAIASIIPNHIGADNYMLGWSLSFGTRPRGR